MAFLLGIFMLLFSFNVSEKYVVEDYAEESVQEVIVTEIEEEPVVQIPVQNESTADYYGIDELKWGMTVDEAKSIIMIESDYEEVVETVNGEVQTLALYKDIPLWNHNTELTLCYVEGLGLNGYNFRMNGDVYDDIYDILFTKYGDVAENTEYDSMWWPVNENYFIYLFTYEENGGIITQCSFYPAY